jgi:hypothetical protein
MMKYCNKKPFIIIAVSPQIKATEMKKTLFALLLCSLSLTACVKADRASRLGDQVNREVAQEVAWKEAVRGKKLGNKAVSQILGKKMRAHRGELKLATRNDCIETYGPEKLRQCQCLANKLDYDAVFRYTQKYRANPRGDYRYEISRLDAMTARAYRICGLRLK